MNFGNIELATKRLAAVNRPSRRRIVSALIREGPMTVTDMYIYLGAKHYSGINAIMSQMRKLEILTSEKHGQKVWYDANRMKIKHIEKVLRKKYHEL